MRYGSCTLAHLMEVTRILLAYTTNEVFRRLNVDSLTLKTAQSLPPYLREASRSNRAVRNVCHCDVIFTQHPLHSLEQ